MERLFLVDAYALIYRFYYAFMGRPMRNRDGVNTSPIFGFAKFLRDIVNQEHPRYLGVAFDPRGGTFRTEIYPEYKANRNETPEDIITAVPYIKRILEAMCIPILEVPRYEADDVIGTLSVKAAQEGFEVFMVTPDKDFGQLIQPHVKIYKQRKNGEGVEIIGCERLKEQYGIDDPRLIIDILALWGDASDNIPGVPGIGEKSAIKLVNDFGTVEDILAHIGELKGKQQENIIANREQLLLSKTLATIDTNVPIDFEPEELQVCAPHWDDLRAVYKELDFNMFIRELDSIRNGMKLGGDRELGGNRAQGVSISASSAPIGENTENAARQHDLFGNVVETGKTAAKSKIANTSEPPVDLFSGGSSEYETIEATPHEYRLVTTLEQFREVLAKVDKTDNFSFDTETSGFDCRTDRICGVSLAITEGEAFYIYIEKDDPNGFLTALKPYFEDASISKTGQNLKFDIMMLAEAGIAVKGFLYDTMILHYLIDPESRHGINHLARLYLNYSPIEIESLIGHGSKQITMDMVSAEEVADYGAEDADIALKLKNVLWPKVQENSLEELYRTIEEPLITVLADMERAGVRIDSSQLASYGEDLRVELEKIERQVRDITGEPDLNINSARQLGVALFDKLKLEPKPKKTKTGQYSTDEEALQGLSDKYPVINLILEYRGLKKLLSTYIDALPLLVNRCTGKVHTSFNQAVTATGRLSSTNPNLQNIPIRDAQGRQIRKAFIPSDEDHLLLSVDYSQVELRIMAHLSGDQALIEAFRNGEDIHRATAARLFGLEPADVTAEHRRKAKTANFGIIYGISAFGLKQRMGNISMGEAKEIIEGYFRSYPGVKQYMDRVIAEARDRGYVETIFGRRRYLPDIRSGNATTRGLAERNAINAPIQGSAADIIKVAMSRVHSELEKRGLKSKMILQVHDELVLDMLRSEQNEVVPLVVTEMENAARLSVELLAEYGIGENWLEAH